MTIPYTVAIFGATGRTGCQLLAAAHRRGWQVRTLVRPIGRSLTALPNLHVACGDFSSSEAVAEVVAGTDAVCCVFGPRPPYTDVFCAAATRAVIAAMNEQGVRRLICQTGAMIGTDLPNWSTAIRWMARVFQWHRPAVAADRLEQEKAVRESGLEWTIVKPPRLVDGPRRGDVRVGPRLRIGVFAKVTRADLAEVILNEVAAPHFLSQAVFVVG